MKMKKIIYVCLLVVLAISFGCEKEEIDKTEQKAKNISDVSSKKVKGKETNEAKRQQQTSLILDPMPPGTQTMDIYLNMTTIEDEYNNDPSNLGYIGEFNVFYRNYYKNNFSIYIIEFSNKNCRDNIEKWTVNQFEYLNFVNDPYPTDGSNTSDNSAPKPPPLKKNDEEEEDEGNVRHSDLLYPNCFN